MAQNLRQIVDSRQALEAEGTSEGARKGWETRRGGGGGGEKYDSEGHTLRAPRGQKSSDRRVSSKIPGLPSDRPPKGMLERRKAERRGTSGEKIFSPGGKSRYMSKEERDRINEEHLKSND
jgi:hypothetical protein